MINEITVENMRIKNPFGDTKMGNRFLIHEEDAYPMLKAIHDGMCPFSSDAYAMLADSMERLYKGVLLELNQMYPEQYKIPSDIARRHDFKYIAAHIESAIAITGNPRERKGIMERLFVMPKAHTRSGCKSIYEKSDFDRDFALYESQRERMLRGLDMERAKYETKEAGAW